MKIDKDQIEHLAGLANLMLSEKEKERFAQDISSIIGYVDQLTELTVSEKEIFLEKDGQLFRDDESVNIFSREKCLAEAPEIEKDQFKVKAVFDR